MEPASRPPPHARIRKGAMKVSSNVAAARSAFAAILLVLGFAMAAAIPPRDEPGFAAGPAYAQDHVVVKLRPDAGPDALRGERGIEPLFLTWYRVGVRPGETPEAAVLRLRALPGVATTERDNIVRAFTTDPAWPEQQWNFGLVEADAAWAKIAQAGKTPGANVTVAILDTGLFWPGSDFNPANVQFSVSSYYGTDLDLNGHGTHVAGTIGQLPNTIGATGLAWGARLHPIKVLDN